MSRNIRRTFFAVIFALTCTLLTVSCTGNEEGKEADSIDKEKTEKIQEDAKNDDQTNLSTFEEYITYLTRPESNYTLLKKGNLENGIARIYHFTSYKDYKNKYKEYIENKDLKYIRNRNEFKHISSREGARGKIYPSTLQIAVITGVEISWLYPDEVDEVYIEFPMYGKTYILSVTSEQLRRSFPADPKRIVENHMSSGLGDPAYRINVVKPKSYWNDYISEKNK